MKQKTKQQDFKPDLVIDASFGVLGRIASFAAKQSLLGKKVAIVNCNNAIITGNPRSSINEYIALRRKGGTAIKGPFFPKSPEKIIKRTIRGMLSHKQQRGLLALRRIFCYNGIPEEFSSSKKISLSREIKNKSMLLAELSKEI